MNKHLRIRWVDIFKGLAIISVVLGHSSSPITATIYLFHMPAFFFISGYTTNLEKYQVSEFFMRRVRSLIAPFWGINLALILLWLILAAAGLNQQFFSQEVNTANCINHLRAVVFRLQPAIEIGGASWFVVALFFAAISAKLWHELIRYFKGANWLVLLATCMVATGVLIGAQEKDILPYSIDLGLIGAFFFTAGAFASRYDFIERGVRPWLGGCIAFAGLWYFTEYHWIKMNFPGRDFASLYEMSLSSACGVYALYLIAKCLERVPLINDAVSYVGKNSFAILSLHFLGFKFGFLLLISLGVLPTTYLIDLVPTKEAAPYWHLFSLLGVLFPLLCVALVSRRPLLSYLLFAQDSEKAQSFTRNYLGAK